MKATTWALLSAVISLLFGCALNMPGESFSGELPAMTAGQRELSGQLKRHVEMLATTIGPRTALQYPDKLERAALYIENEFLAMGYKSASLPYTCRGAAVRNIEATLDGSDKDAGVIVIGAHYDSCYDTPAANDNASGIAAMLELARRARALHPQRTIRFVAFVNEEPPYFFTPEMGSYVYAAGCKARGDKIVAMMSLETMGYYSDRPRSQKYPWPFSMFYPNKGDFIAFVTRTHDRELLFRVIKTFRDTTQFPSEGAAMPPAIEGIAFSDHWSFWQHDYPALMVTDTAMFRYPYYHAPGDTPDKIDFDRLARVTGGLARVIESLAQNQ